MKKNLHLIKITVKAYLDDAEVRLFGSRSKSDSGDESDYDILVITERFLTPKEKFPVKTSIRKALLKYGIRSDVLIQSKNDIETKKKLPGHLIRNIMKDAIWL